MAKTAKFAVVVENCGAPAVFLAWTAPEKDPTFARALKQGRVLSVHQEIRGAKKDFGEVGYHPGPRAQFLIFPKSLRAFVGKRVIAIDYALFEGRLEDASSLALLKPGQKGSDAARRQKAVAPPDRPKAEVVPFPLSETKAHADVPDQPKPGREKPPTRQIPPAKPEREKRAPKLPRVSAALRPVLRAIQAELKQGKVRYAEEQLTALLAPRR